MPPLRWNLDEAINYTRTLQKIAWKCNLHLALAGSVLNHGESTKDLDIIVMSFNNGRRTDWKRFLANILQFGEINLKTKEEYNSADRNIYDFILHNGKKIDLFVYDGVDS